MLTAITEITRNASTASRGLKQVSSRLTQVLDDSSATGKKLTEIYDSLGIALKDSEGQIRSTYDILADLAEQWDNLSKNEQEYIALTSAGSNQVQNFTALMENFSVAVEATATAYDSSGSASKENEKAMDTIEKKLQVLRSQFEQLIIGEGGLQNVAKWFLDVGIAILKFANSDVGQTIIKVTALVTTMALLNKAFVALKATMSAGTGIGIFLNAIQSLIVGETTLTAVTGTLTTALLSNPLFWGAAAIVGITLLITAIDKFNVTLDEQIEKLNEAKSAYESAQSELEGLESQLKSVRDRIDEINDKDNLSITDETQLRLLQEEEASLEHQVLLQQELARAAKEEATTEAKKTLGKTFQNAEIFGLERPTEPGRQEWVAGSGTIVEAVENSTQKINDEQDAIDSLLSTKKILENANMTESDSYKEINDSIVAHMATRDGLRNEVLDYAQTVESAIAVSDEEDETIQQAIVTMDGYYAALERIDGAEQELQDTTIQTTEDLEEYSAELEELEENISKLASSLGLTNSQLERYESLMDMDTLEGFLQNLYDIRQASEDASDGIDSLQSALETAIEAQAEYSENGALTLDTFQSLMGISAEYLVALQNEEGQLEINQTTLGNLVEQMKIAKIEELQAAATADLLAYSQGQVGQMSDFAKGIVSELGNNIESTGSQAETASGKMNSFAVSVANAVSASGGTVDWDDSGQKAILEGYEELAGKIADLTIDTTRYGNTVSKSTSKATSVVKEQKSALDELKDKYSVVIDFILEQYDKQIDKIKDTKEAQLDAIDDEIDALQAERDAREKYWDDQLDTLEKENTERERNIELQKKQQALALAQQSQVMILKGGKFVYSQDEGEVATAQQDLIETQEQQEYERQRERMEELRDAELEWYDERIKQKEAYRDYLEKYYDEQIEALEEEKDAVNEVLEQGTADQQGYWNQMIAQLNSFVSEWNALVGSLKTPRAGGSVLTKAVARITAKSTGDNSVSAYANGKGSVGDSEIAVVGENPKYRELVIGSKLNNDQGAVMSLKRGSGVVNAGATNTLASIFNALNGQSSNAQQVSNNSNRSTSITIGSISLPDVKDGKGFVDYLQNFSTDITQLSYARS